MAILVSPDKPVIPLSIIHHKNCRTMAIGESVNKVKNIPVAETIITVGSSHHKMYLTYANNKFGNHYTYGTYMNGNFNTCMGKLKMKHLPHDGRHTFASLMDSAGANDVCIKLIMGHSMKNDTTKGTYTHKTLEELLTEVNKI